ncbi:MAG TPA: hypothetical protein PKD86_14075 [Gemmatales bacterium]|nr:hypothetical protein [Gemmatales bacterium]HMP60471.1 hypothetical protein [Gemmatales bacterium]
MSSSLQGQPSLAELVQAHLGYAWTPRPEGEVEPHQAALLPRWPAQSLWPEAVTAGRMLATPDRTAHWDQLACPPAWAEWIAKQPVRRAIPCALGLAPQFLAEVAPLLERGWEALAEAQPGPALSSSEAPADPLLAAALARLAGDFSLAAQLLAAAEPQIPVADRPVWENERAALAWEEGRADEAAALWRSPTLAETAVGRFNLGLYLLRRGERAAALPLLEAASAQFPVHTGWHHLAELYRCLASA